MMDLFQMPIIDREMYEEQPISLSTDHLAVLLYLFLFFIFLFFFHQYLFAICLLAWTWIDRSTASPLDRQDDHRACRFAVGGEPRAVFRLVREAIRARANREWHIHHCCWSSSQVSSETPIDRDISVAVASLMGVGVSTWDFGGSGLTITIRRCCSGWGESSGNNRAWRALSNHVSGAWALTGR